MIIQELRTPINAIVGMSSLLGQTSLTSVQEEFIDALISSSEGLLVLIDDLLNISKIESGKLELEQVPFSIEKILKVLIKGIGLKAEERGIDFNYFNDPQISNYHIGDPTRLNQIISNLASNAIKFTQHGSVKIAVSLIANSEEIQELKISIRDTSIGIAVDRQQAIFQKFSQADSSTTRKFGGTGLGLAISKQLVELMCSELHLSSEKGCGSIFSFTIQLTPTDAPAKKETSETKDLNNAKILIVEDNEINRFLVLTILKSWNAQVATANDGTEAIDLLKTEYYDLILMDLQMPNMGGMEAT